MRFESRLSFRRALWVAAFALTAFAACVHAQTYNFRVLHRFSGHLIDGQTPLAHVEFDAAGNLYGATAYGGAGTAGTIFKIAKDGTESILHSFEPFADGYYPLASVTIDPATGDLYGTAPVGGVSAGCILEQGCGVLYKLAPDGTYTLLEQFGAQGDAAYSRPILDPQGNLYGTTEYGQIYKFSASGRLSVLYSFDDGSRPSGVIRDAGGNLYGATSFGLAGGTVFKLAPNGTLTTLHVFGSGGEEGTYPVGDLTRDKAGNLYGATDCCVYKLAPDGTLTVLYDFNSFPDGLGPNGGLVLIGDNLYGTTVGGGNDVDDCHVPTGYNGCGTVFKLAPDGTKTILHKFLPPDGTRPGGSLTGGSLTYKNGRLYGTTQYGENSIYGTVYSIGVAKP